MTSKISTAPKGDYLTPEQIEEFGGLAERRRIDEAKPIPMPPSSVLEPEKRVK